MVSIDVSAHVDTIDPEVDASVYPTFSDDLEALHDQETDLIVERNRQGIVIQHRAWKLPDSFHSDDDRSFGTLDRTIRLFRS